MNLILGFYAIKSGFSGSLGSILGCSLVDTRSVNLNMRQIGTHFVLFAVFCSFARFPWVCD